MQYFIYHYYYYYVIYGLSLKRAFKKREKSIMSDATTGYYIYIKSNKKKISIIINPMITYLNFLNEFRFVQKN